jgi:hypothetical protein
MKTTILTSEKNAVFWDVTPCGFCNSRNFGGAYHLHQQGENKFNIFRIVLRLLVTANIPSSMFNFTLIMEAIR